MTALERYFIEVSGEVVSTCNLCYHETRALDEKENHAFDCGREGRKNDLYKLR